MNKPLRLIPVSMSLVAALVLAGCGDSEDATGNTAATTPTSQTPTETPSETQSDTPSASPEDSTTPDDAAETDAVFATAIRTAEDAVKGSVAIDYDRDEDDDDIDIDVVAGGVEYELELSADGTRVLSQERDDRLDGDDLAKVRAAKVLITEAVATALAQAPGTVEDVELDREDGVVRWEIEIKSGGSTTELYVDAASGKLIG